MKGRFIWLVLLAMSAALVLPGTALAQTSGISGEVLDETGGVLPGVVIEATSPALLAEVRTVVTDGQGRYSVVSLPSGVYLVTYTLPGFSTVRREGVELVAGFTANIDTQMVVGGVEETITVTGATPTVDVQNVRTQNVLDDDTLNLLPNAQTVSSFAALTLGARLTGNASTGGGVDVGGSGGEMGTAQIHNNRADDMKISQDGLSTNNSMRVNGGILHMGQHYNMEAVAEVTISHNGMSADTETAGLQMNYIPKEGGNVFSASARASHTTEDWNNDNLTPELEARGASSPPKIRNIYDYGGGVGGPIKRDRVWFYTAHRWWGASSFSPGAFFNDAQGDLSPAGIPLFQPGAPAFNSDPSQENSVRITIQAWDKDKITYYGNRGHQCLCGRSVSATLAHEAAIHARANNNHISQVTWTRAQSNSVLFEGGFSWLVNPFIFARHQAGEGGGRDVGLNDIQITDFANPATGSFLIYNAWFVSTIPYNEGDPGATDQYNGRFSTSYVTGSHSFKVGGTFMHGWIESTGSANILPGFGPVGFTAFGGVPQSITLFTHPQYKRSDYLNSAIYAQDQWTFDRVTLNLGVRADFFRGYTPEQDSPASVFVTGFHVDELRGTPSWNNISPRLGVSWDITGDGKTAFKAQAGQYMAGMGTGLPLDNNPSNSISTSNTRTWADDGDGFPQGDPTLPEANGELGPSTNPAFGTPRIVSFFDDDMLTTNRPYTWQMSAGVDREIRDNVRVSVTYFRTSHYNQTVRDNETVGPEDYDPFSVIIPAGLPGAGQVVDGLFNITPGALATIPRNTTKNAGENFGDFSEVFNGVDIETNARFDNGALVQGGVTFGETVNNDCFTIDSPQNLYQCEVATPWWSGNGQVKLSGSYPLPGEVELSAVYQNIPGASIQANATFFSADVIGLGRPLSGLGRVTVPLLEPNADYDGRLNQLDFRVAKVFRFEGAMARITFDLYNATNSSSILTRNNTYGTTGAGWGNVTGIMPGRLFKLGGQFSWN